MSVRIASVAVSQPPHRLRQEEAARRIGEAIGEPRRVAALARGSQIEERAIVLPALQVGRLGSIEERNAVYARLAPSLALSAARAAVTSTAAPIGFVATTSCTGYLSPGLDVSLVDSLPLAMHTVRLPISEAGCAGGVVALGRAVDYLRARPSEAALVVAVELCSLAFHAEAEEGNLISALIFGDGGGAAVLESSGTGRGLEVVDAESALVPGTRRHLGFDLTDRGFYPLLTRALVDVLPGPTAGAVGRLLARNGLSAADVSFWLLHPGGSRILAGLERCLRLPPGSTRWSWQSLRERGNTSSAAVFDVLHRYLTDEHAPRGWGVVAAFGPGVSVELLLVRSC